jgi:ADP-heptose:LPS heptosyltransferase
MQSTSFVSIGGAMLKKFINVEEFKLGGEIPLLIKLRLKKLMVRHTTCGDRTLVVDTCIIGDFIATLPALRLFIQNSKHEVDLIVSPPVKTIAEAIIGVHTVYTAISIYKRNYEKQSEQKIQPHEYGHVLVLRISQDAYELLNQFRYSDMTTYDIPFIKYFAHIFWSTLLKKNVRQWRDVNYEMAGVVKPSKDLVFDDIFSANNREYDRVRALPEMQGLRKRIIIHTGSGWHVKLWDDMKWIDTIKKINQLGEYDFIFIGGGEKEANSFAYIQQHLNFPVRSLINKIDLKTTLLVMRLSSFFIGIDSGPRNMAHLADLRSISLLGPAPRNFMPVHKDDIVIDKFTCRCKSLFYFHKVSALTTLMADEVVDNFKKLTLSASNREQPLPMKKIA